VANHVDPRFRREITAIIFLKLLFLAAIWLAFVYHRVVVVTAERAAGVLGVAAQPRSDSEGK
jgi:hypothetical protein